MKNLTLLWICLLLAIPCQARIIYVDADANGLNTGSSWADAFNDLQDALTAASSGDEIRVAQGIYKPDQGGGNTPGDREATFQLINGVTLKGGYAGFGQPDPNARDIQLYETILSGDLAGDDGPDFANNGENSYHVVTGSGTDANTVLDGFTITAGNAYGPWVIRGGGMYNIDGSPMVANCTFTSNSARYSGGGMYNNSGSPVITNCSFKGNYAVDGGGMENYEACPTLSNCTFTGNSAGPYGGGGGMLNYMESSPALTNCTFTGNSAPWGGGVYNQWSSPTFTNCFFSCNSAWAFGGGMNNSFLSSPSLTFCVFIDNSSDFCGGALSIHERSAPTMTNCTFTGNRAVEGGGMHIRYTSSPTLTNCTFAGNLASHGSALACNSFQQGFPSNLQVTNSILWNGDGDIWNNDWSTITVTYTDVQGGWPGIGNIDADPCFVDLGYWDANGVWVDGDYHLLTGSPCIDAGDPNYIAEPNETDLDGKPRIIGGRIDMGAYEYAPTILAEARIVPRTINLASKGRWITCYISLPEDYNVADIDANSVFLEDTVPAASLSVDEHKQVATARFSREDVQSILDIGDINLTITGQLTDGTIFEGTDVITVIDKASRKSPE